MYIMSVYIIIYICVCVCVCCICTYITRDRHGERDGLSTLFLQSYTCIDRQVDRQIDRRKEQTDRQTNKQIRLDWIGLGWDKIRLHWIRPEKIQIIQIGLDWIVLIHRQTDLQMYMLGIASRCVCVCVCIDTCVMCRSFIRQKVSEDTQTDNAQLVYSNAEEWADQKNPATISSGPLALDSEASRWIKIALNCHMSAHVDTPSFHDGTGASFGEQLN